MQGFRLMLIGEGHILYRPKPPRSFSAASLQLLKAPQGQGAVIPYHRAVLPTGAKFLCCIITFDFSIFQVQDTVKEAGQIIQPMFRDDDGLSLAISK